MTEAQIRAALAAGRISQAQARGMLEELFANQGFQPQVGQQAAGQLLANATAPSPTGVPAAPGEGNILPTAATTPSNVTASGQELFGGISADEFARQIAARGSLDRFAPGALGLPPNLGGGGDPSDPFFTPNESSIGPQAETSTTAEHTSRTLEDILRDFSEEFGDPFGEVGAGQQFAGFVPSLGLTNPVGRQAAGRGFDRNFGSFLLNSDPTQSFRGFLESGQQFTSSDPLRASPSDNLARAIELINLGVNAPGLFTEAGNIGASATDLGLLSTFTEAGGSAETALGNQLAAARSGLFGNVGPVTARGGNALNNALTAIFDAFLGRNPTGNFLEAAQGLF